MATFWSDVGTSALSGGLGMAFGAAANAINYKYKKRMAKYNYKLNEMAADNADARRRALYEDYESPIATIRQLKDAGLSPSIYASGELGGTIGSTAGAQGAGGSGQEFNGSMMSPMEFSQIKVQEAQARKLNAEADELEGTNAMGDAKVKELLASAGLKDAETSYTNAKTKLTNIDIYVKDKEKEFSIKKTEYEAKIAENDANRTFWDAENAQFEWTWNVETFEKEKEKLSNEVAEIAARTAYEKSGVRLNDAEKNAIRDYAEAAIKNADAHAQSATSYGEYVGLLKEQMPKELEQRKEELNVEKWRIGVNAVTDVLTGGMHMLGMQMFGSNKSEGAEKLVEHFDNKRNLTGGTKTQYRRSSGRRK